MPEYTVRAPDGKEHKIDGPVGATDEQIIAEVQRQLGVPAEPQQKSMTAGDVAISAIEHVPESAYGLVKPFIEQPGEVAKGMGRMAVGGLQLLSGDADISRNVAREDVKAIGEDYKKKYGSIEAIKHTLATDPVGMLADLSMLFGGGEFTAARAASLPGKVGEIASTTSKVAGAASRATNPFELPGALARGTRTVGREAVGVLTHTGPEPLKIAASAGYEGGERAKAFRESMRGQRPMEEVVQEARGAINKMREEKSVGYQHGMARLDNTKILDFTDIDKAVQDAGGIKTFKGQDLDPGTAAIRKEMVDAIEEWKKLPPQDFHTLEGMDALKQKLGSIMDSAATPTERTAAGRIYHGVRDTIVKADKEYARVMQGYELASQEIKEIEKALQLGKGAAVDSALRRLQSVLRNNVHTNYGNRRVLAEHLAKVGSPELLERLAGQTLGTWTPRGLGKLGLQVGAELAALGFGTHAVGLGAAAAMAPVMAASSPRLMGELAYYGGRASSPLKYLPEGTARAGLVGSETARALTSPMAPGQ